MSAPGIANSLAFSISPAKPSKNKSTDDDDYSLTLAPFTKAPKISFGTVKLNTLVERNLLIINPQSFEVKLNVLSQELAINNLELIIDKMSNVNFKIKWQPDKADSYKYTIFFEVINNARLKFLVHCYGVCTAPVVKKGPRKPFTMLQPIKKEKSATFADTKTKTMAATVKPPNKENNLRQTTQEPKKKVGLTFETTTVKTKKTVIKTPIQEFRTTSITSSKTFQKTETNQTFLVESIYNRPPKIVKANIYNASFEMDMPGGGDTGVNSELPKSSTLYDIRRQTCIIGSPRITKDGKLLNTMDDNDNQSCLSKTPLRRSFSAANIPSPSNYSIIDNSLVAGSANQNRTNFGSYETMDSTHHEMHSTKVHPPSPNVVSTLTQFSPTLLEPPSVTPQHVNIIVKTDDTPKLDDFLNANPSIQVSQDPSNLAHQLDYDMTPFQKIPMPNKYLHKTPHELYTTCYDDAEESFQALNNMMQSEELFSSVLVVQRQWRMKIFRRKLKVLKMKRIQDRIDLCLEKERQKEEYLRKLEASVCLIVKAYRMKRFRRALGHQREQERLRIELAYRDYQKRLSCAAVVVQRAYRMRKFRRALYDLRAKEYQRKVGIAVLMIQKAIRMKIFRRNLENLKEQEYQQKLLLATILVQQTWRMKQFRRSLVQLKRDQAHFLTCVVTCQRSYRMKVFRNKLTQLKQETLRKIESAKLAEWTMQSRAASVIQHQWALYKFRCQMTKYRTASIIIQRWVRYDMSERFTMLRKKRAVLVIQRAYRRRFQELNRQAIVIQKNWRMWKEMTIYSYQMHQVIKIQRWVRSKAQRFMFLKVKRSVKGIQKLARVYIQSREKAAIIIQRQYRMHRFRICMLQYRTAAIQIQTFHRSMATRYDFLRKKTIICQIQALYRRIYMPRRRSAATLIQATWRMYKARCLRQVKYQEWLATEELRLKELHLHVAATKIQAWWRGYVIRKETDQILRSIRGRLSVYIQSSKRMEFTLGARIRNSLSTLGCKNVTIPQVITALIDLEKVTRLSPECCLLFAKEGAPEILYDFMLNCNRSVPHMDLIKFCLHILINLAKYEKTCASVLEPVYSLVVLSNLIQSYQSSNPVIFIDVCILFIHCAQFPPLASHLLAQESFVKKLQGLYTIISRRNQFKLKNLNTTPSISAPSTSLNTTITPAANLPTITKKSIVKFSILPDWSLCKKTFIEFPDQLTALEYLLNTLSIKYDSDNNVSGTKTPIKNRTLNRDVMSSSKSTTSISKSITTKSAQKNRVPLSKSQSANFKGETPIYRCANQYSKSSLKNRLEDIENQLEEHQIDELSVCVGDMTVASVGGEFMDEPKMNSTIMMANKAKQITSKLAASTIASTNKQASRRKLI